MLENRCLYCLLLIKSPPSPLARRRKKENKRKKTAKNTRIMPDRSRPSLDNLFPGHGRSRQKEKITLPGPRAGVFKQNCELKALPLVSVNLLPSAQPLSSKTNKRKNRQKHQFPWCCNLKQLSFLRTGLSLAPTPKSKTQGKKKAHLIAGTTLPITAD